ncbi:MAG: UDP-N-acetylmuramoyl-L-alanine--D-glutamate ligase [Eubacterium sp.]|nr:UDP-N-acetylmuramoyl-L-alanine--D-glutamate ligase [Eubacterium sp.]SEF56945.1 UDP-N-acetylmuramoylalanine--D-glutamate ligase [Eubacterium ruminantium]
MKDKKVIVAGAGKSGFSSSGLLLRNGARVILFDENDKLDKEELLKGFSGVKNIRVVLGKLTARELKDADLMVISPGIPVDSEFVLKVKEHGIPVWSEIELAYYFNKGKIAAITGTNGKTTTTTLVGEIFKAHSDNSVVVGNIGIPFAQFADSTDEETFVAAEISSFQLETIHDFRPRVSAILNLTPDHLNRHYTFDNYARAKFDITKNQTEEDVCILNYDDPETMNRRDWVSKARVVCFSRTTVLPSGVYVKNGAIYVKDKEDSEEIFVIDLKDIKILGDHNVENVLAAVAVTYYMGIPVETIAKVISEFMGVEHRIEFVRKIGGVSYYNDSKGTNPDAAIKALKAMKSTTLLIGGGYDKKSTYDEWVDEFKAKVRYLVLIGETAEDIAKCAKNHGFNNIVFMDTLRDAVMFCNEHAMPQDSVLLSPACASWDMFKSYEERGKLFKQYVNEIEDPESDK